MIDRKTLTLSLKSLREFAKKRLPDAELIALDERDECPLDSMHEEHGRNHRHAGAERLEDASRRRPHHRRMGAAQAGPHQHQVGRE